MNNRQHLMWRAGFGPHLQKDLTTGDNSTSEILFQQLLNKSKNAPTALMVLPNSEDGLDTRAIMRTGKGGLTPEQKADIRKRNREGFKQLNLLWLDEMTNSEAQLREKISLFWHGHFACRVNNVRYQQELLHSIRSNALGDFKTLLLAVSRSAAMLSFLNNQQNRKKRPNENFARELMELFTMGRGNYTEQDIKESARAFTGWGFDLNGQFVFRQALHDNDEKNFLGKKGNFSGEDIIDIILNEKQTARFLSSKIISFYTGSVLPDSIINPLAEQFYQSKYDISILLKSIFTSNWFYDEKYKGNRIKSPVEWMVGIRRTIPLDQTQKDWQLIMEKLLGQVLFFPPNVAGWPGGNNWIDSSTLMYRLRFPVLLSSGHSAELGKPKTDDDLQMGKPENQEKNKTGNTGINVKIAINADWQNYIQQFETVPRGKLMANIRASLLVADHLQQVLLEKHINKSSREDFIRSLTIRLMSTPDYQMC